VDQGHGLETGIRAGLMKHRVGTAALDARRLRSFGCLMGGICVGLGLWSVVAHADPRWWAIVIGVLLGVLGLTRPMALRSFYLLWMRVGHALGWVNTRLILGAIFYGVMTPMAVVMRLFGRDPLHLRLDRGADSYRVPSEPRPIAHLWHQF